VGQTPTGRVSWRTSTAAVTFANHRLGEGSCASLFEGRDADRLHYVRAGDGPTIVFVHGFPSFWYCWIRQIESLRDRFTCIAVDMPGAGASSRSGDISAYRVPSLAARLTRFICAVAPEQRVLLVGHDWGASLSFAIAQARPDLFAGVCGIAAPPYNQFLGLFAESAGQQARSAYMEGLRTMTAERAKSVAAEVGRSAYQGLRDRDDICAPEHALFAAACGDPAALKGGADWYRANICAPGMDTTSLAWPADDPPLTIPAQLIWGDADQTFEPDAPRDFAARQPNGSVIHLPGVGHWCMLQAADVVNDHLRRFAMAQFDRQPAGTLS
jgi:pimeloyl-ACP methyl ester carboxylesterase